MPIYLYKNKKTGKEIEVIRSFEEYENVPTVEEGASEEDKAEDWERVMQTYRLIKGANWGPGKGHWMLALMFLAATLLGSTPTKANEYHLLEPRDTYIDTFQYYALSDPYLTPLDKKLKNGANFHLGVNILTVKDRDIYMENSLFFDQSSPDGKVKHGGWRYRMAAELVKVDGQSKVEVFWEHESRHVFEEVRPAHFPNMFRYGVRLNLIKGK